MYVCVGHDNDGFTYVYPSLMHRLRSEAWARFANLAAQFFMPLKRRSHGRVSRIQMSYVTPRSRTAMDVVSNKSSSPPPPLNENATLDP